VTVYRWVQRFTPLLIDAARPCRHVLGDRWFADETSWESQGVAARILRVGPAGCRLSRWRVTAARKLVVAGLDIDGGPRQLLDLQPASEVARRECCHEGAARVLGSIAVGGPAA